MDPLDQYFADQLALITQPWREPLNAVLALLERARAERRHIFVFGNGGSATTATHFACDLGKGTVRPNLPRFKVTALHDNLAMFSAYANDQGYDRVFAEPLISLAEPGDIAIGFSVSGTSPNVLRALEVANARGLVTVAFAGRDGGAMKSLAHYAIVVPSPHYGHVEDLHLMMTHALCHALNLQHEPH